MKLTLTQLTAMQAVQGILNQAHAELAAAKAKADQATAKLQAIMTECGLDPAKNWALGADGTVQEQTALRRPNRIKPPEESAGNHQGAVPVAPDGRNGLEETLADK
jgi:hypothetical protein